MVNEFCGLFLNDCHDYMHVYIYHFNNFNINCCEIIIFITNWSPDIMDNFLTHITKLLLCHKRKYTKTDDPGHIKTYSNNVQPAQIVISTCIKTVWSDVLMLHQQTPVALLISPEVSLACDQPVCAVWSEYLLDKHEVMLVLSNAG